MSVLVPTLFVLMLYETLSVKAAELALNLCHEASTCPGFREGCATQVAPGAALEIPLLPVPRPETGGGNVPVTQEGDLAWWRWQAEYVDVGVWEFLTRDPTFCPHKVLSK